MVGHFPENKLTLIKPVGIREQQFQLRDDHVLRKTIDIRMILLLYIICNAVEHYFLLVTKMQRFADRIAEEFILFDGPCQRCIPQKVRVYEHHPPRGAFGYPYRYFKAEDLLRGDEEQHAFLGFPDLL